MRVHIVVSQSTARRRIQRVVCIDLMTFCPFCNLPNSGCISNYLQTYFGNPEHSPDLHLWSLPATPAHDSPLSSLGRQAFTLASTPRSHHFPDPQSESLLQTQVPLVSPPTGALHLPSRHSSSKRQDSPIDAEAGAEQNPVLHRPAWHC